MRGLRLFALLASAALVLCGCSTTGEVENQAYALVLGVETAEAGGIALTIRIPRIGKTGSNSEGQESEPYLVLSAEGDGYAQALEHLQWAAARELNLSHLKLIIVSESLAESEAFPRLIRAIAETRHLYTTAGFVVCEGSAKDFIEGQETILGTRLSSEITAMFKHYASHGAIPSASFADLYFATLSGLSDPAAIRGFLDEGEAPQSDEAAAIIGGSPDAMRRTAQTASARQYLGAAVFRDGRLAARLDAADTLYLNLLTSRLDSFAYACDGKAYTLSCVRCPGCRVTVDGGDVDIAVSLWLTCEEDATREALNAVAQSLKGELEGMIRRCQQMDIEPFGFAERAAMRFLTVEDWRRFDWRARYPAARVSVAAHIACSGS